MNDRDYGKGATEFALQFIERLTREEALPVLISLNKGELHDQTDKRIKRCDYCGHLWRDDSLRNTKRTCSDDCKTGIKTLQRRQQRADKALLNPKLRKRVLADDYIYWLEYPFWINEYSMTKIGWKYERPSGIALMDYVETTRDSYGPGNRKKSNRVVDYYGDKQF